MSVIDGLIKGLIYGLVHRGIDGLIDWLIDWLIEGRMHCGMKRELHCGLLYLFHMLWFLGRGIVLSVSFCKFKSIL